MLVSEKRDLAATRRFLLRALEHGPRPREVSTDQAPAYPRVVDDLLPAACHVMDRYANNPIESDHGRLKSRLRPMRNQTRWASTWSATIRSCASVVGVRKRSRAPLSVVMISLRDSMTPFLPCGHIIDISSGRGVGSLRHRP